MGKGSRRRPTSKSFDDNFEAIFGKREIKTWTPPEEGVAPNDDKGSTSSTQDSGKTTGQ